MAERTEDRDTTDQPAGDGGAPYVLYYWPGLPGRGEFVRLVLEEAGAAYVDVAHQDDRRAAAERVMRFVRGEEQGLPPLAPPILKAGALVLAQVANICMFLGQRHGLAPADEAGRLHANQLQLTIADLVAEAHDTHHPIGTGLYYEDQKPEAQKRAQQFTTARMPKFLGYFERVLAYTGSGYLVGTSLSYVDISMFQVLEGLAYAFPNAFAALRGDIPRLLALRDRVAARPNIAAYLQSERRLAFNESGIFRRYPELDTPAT